MKIKQALVFLLSLFRKSRLRLISLPFWESWGGASLLVLLLAMSCENKTAGHSQHNMTDMEGMNISTMNDDTTMIERELYDVVNSVNEIVISNQETVKPIVRELGNNISADGYIAIDERRNNTVSARFGGRIEKLYVRYNYQYVKKGEKIMELYSPEVNTLEGEYIHHLTTFSDKNLIQKTKEKLLLFGLLESEITAIAKTGKPLKGISIYSPYEGYVLFGVSENKSSVNISETQSGMNMGATSTQNKSPMQSPPSQIKKGSYVNEGQTLFIVNDFKEVWAIVGFGSQDESRIKINSVVTITSESTGESVNGFVNFIEPAYKEGQKFTQARVYLKNEKQRYTINSLVTLKISEGEKVLSIPSSSILELGKRKIVWVKTGMTKEGSKSFQARNIIAGGEMNGFTEIISGITEGDEIAKDAGYLIDSESLITSLRTE